MWMGLTHAYFGMVLTSGKEEGVLYQVGVQKNFHLYL